MRARRRFLLAALIAFVASAPRAAELVELSHLVGMGHVGRPVWLDSGLILASAWERGLVIVDASHPEDPEDLGCIGSYPYILDCQRSGSLLWIASSFYSAAALDLDGLLEPPTVLDLPTERPVAYIAAEDGLVAYDEPGLVLPLSILDVLDMESPQVIGRLPVYAIQELVLRDGWVWAACGGIGLVGVDCRDHASPVVRVEMALGLARSLAFAGPWLCVGTEDGLQVLDVSDPFEPMVIGLGPSQLRPMSLAWAGSWLAAGTEDRQLVAFDLDDPANPGVLASVALPDTTIGMLYMDACDDVVAVSLDQFGLQFWELDRDLDVSSSPVAPAEIDLVAGPNPFNPSTRIRYSLATALDVQLTVHDTAGRLVRILAEGPRSAGEHELVFDGSNLSSGVYFCRLRAQGRVRTLKIVLAK